MGYWAYGVGFVILVLVVATVKSDFQTRVWLVLALIAAMAWYATRKKR